MLLEETLEPLPARVLSAALAGLVLTLGDWGCVQAKPATDVGDPGYSLVGPSSPGSSPSPPQPLAYIPDLQPVFATDCLQCHRDFFARGGYSMTSYQAVMSAVRPGDASSRLVVDTQPGGSMYRYLSGDRSLKAMMLFNWVVVYSAAERR